METPQKDPFCCSYTPSNMAGYDCLNIPGAFKANPTNTGQAMVPPNVCGNGGLFTNAATGMPTTICSECSCKCLLDIALEYRR